MNLWINAVCYQATWLAAIGGAARGWWWLGPLMALLFAAWQLRVSLRQRADVRLLGCAMVIGFAVDSMFAQAGLIGYGAAYPWPQLAPLWIVALWASFALTLNHSLAYLQTHLLLAALLGAIGAPLAYSAAARWGALTLIAPTVSTLCALGLAWAVLTPALSLLAQRLHRDPAAPALPGTTR